MPDFSEYQNVFRVAKPSGSRRSNSAKRKNKSNGLPAVEQNGSIDDDDNVSKAQARLQKLEEMVTMLIQSNEDASARNGHPTPPSADGSIAPTAVSKPPGAVVPSSFSESSLTTPVVPSNGHLDVSGTETKYIGATHWTAILENVCLRFPLARRILLTWHRSKRYKNASNMTASRIETKIIPPTWTSRM